MMGARRIGISMLDDDLKIMINASAKIFPVAFSYITNGGNPFNYDYVRIIDATHKNEVYIWESNVFSLIGADDINVSWVDVKNKPLVFSPDLHTHNDIYNTKSEIDILEALKVDKVVGKVLSANDFTTILLNKLNGLSESASLDYQTMFNELTAHEANNIIHVTQLDKNEINKVSAKADKSYVDIQDASKVDASTFNGHVGNSTIHVAQVDKDSWNGKTQITQGIVLPTVGYWFKEI